MRLSISSIPELESMPKWERFKFLGKCHLRTFLYWQTWAGLVLAVLIALAGQLLIRYTIPSFTEREAPLYGTSGAVAGWLIGAHISWKIRISVAKKIIRKKFPHLCQSCGYDLRKSQGRCPECGVEMTAGDYTLKHAA